MDSEHNLIYQFSFKYKYKGTRGYRGGGEKYWIDYLINNVPVKTAASLGYRRSTVDRFLIPRVSWVGTLLLLNRHKLKQVYTIFKKSDWLDMRVQYYFTVVVTFLPSLSKNKKNLFFKCFLQNKQSERIIHRKGLKGLKLIIKYFTSKCTLSSTTMSSLSLPLKEVIYY